MVRSLLWGVSILAALLHLAVLFIGKRRAVARAEGAKDTPDGAGSRTFPAPFEMYRVATKALVVPLFLSALLVAGGASGEGAAPLVIAGLVCGWLGDVLLEVPSERSFLMGLGAFLAGHVLYTIWFGQHLGTPPFWSVMVLLVIVVGIVQGVRRLVTTLTVPVAVYAAVLAVSLYVAASAAAAGWRGGYLAAAGAALFIVSDLLLGLRTFTDYVRGAHLPIMTTYFSAQALIGLSTLL